MNNSLHKSVRFRSYSGPYSVRLRENMGKNNSEYEHFLRSDWEQPQRDTLKTEVFLNLVENFNK